MARTKIVENKEIVTEKVVPVVEEQSVKTSSDVFVSVPAHILLDISNKLRKQYKKPEVRLAKRQVIKPSSIWNPITIK